MTPDDNNPDVTNTPSAASTPPVPPQSNSSDTTPVEQTFNEDTFAQPEPAPEAPATPPAENPFGPPLMDTPAPATTPLPDSPADVTNTTSVVETPAAPVAAFPATAKKSKLWLWILLSALVLIIGALTAGYFVIKGAADSAAKNYTQKVKTYVADVYDAANTSAENPADVVKAVKDVAAPTLESAFLSTLSSDYATAETLQTTVTSKVTGLKDQVGEYVNFYDLYQDLQDTEDKLTKADTSNGLTYLTEFYDTLGTYQDQLDNAVVPADIEDNVKTLSEKHKVLYEAWGDALAAYKASDSTAYKAAVKAYTDGLPAFKTALIKVQSYYDDLASKVKDAATTFQDYADTIK